MSGRRLHFSYNRPATIDNHYIVGAGVGAKTRFARSALRRRANNNAKGQPCCIHKSNTASIETNPVVGSGTQNDDSLDVGSSNTEFVCVNDQYIVDANGNKTKYCCHGAWDSGNGCTSNSKEHICKNLDKSTHADPSCLSDQNFPICVVKKDDSSQQNTTERVYTYFTPSDIISSEHIADAKNKVKTPPASCNKTKYSEDRVSYLDIARAWVDAGNTPETAKYALLIVGGEASPDQGTPATVKNEYDAANDGTFIDGVGNPATSGIMQCDTCRSNGDDGKRYYDSNNNRYFETKNICHNIWAATRVVLIPELDPFRQPGEGYEGCIKMIDNDVNTNICNKPENAGKPGCKWGQFSLKKDGSMCCTGGSCPDSCPDAVTEFNYIGPFCHTNVMGANGIRGVAWSSANNFPNNFYRKFLNTVVNGTYSNTLAENNNFGCVTADTSFPNSQKDYYLNAGVSSKVVNYNNSTSDVVYSTYSNNTTPLSENCSYKNANVMEKIAQTIVDCALNNSGVDSILDCPNAFTDENNNNLIQHNICLNTGCWNYSSTDCQRRLNGQTTLPYTNVVNGYVAGNNTLCFGAPYPLPDNNDSNGGGDSTPPPCTCQNGTAASGTSCPSGGNVCQSCNSGYTLSGNQCIADNNGGGGGTPVQCGSCTTCMTDTGACYHETWTKANCISAKAPIMCFPN